MAIGTLSIVGPANAAIIVTFEQVGSDVVANGSGSADLAGLAGLGGLDADPALLGGHADALVMGPAATTEGMLYTGLSGPSGFGSGTTLILASSGSGDHLGLFPDTPPWLIVPVGYVSGSALSATDTWANETFATLGITPGTYEWTWGSGADADSLTLQIGPASTEVPEPATLSIFGAGLAMLGVMRRKRKAN
jgi:hypothetical protein